MSQQTFTPGATQVAEPPAPFLPSGEAGNGGDDNRRKLMVVGAAVGVVVLAIVAFFLLKGGGSSSSSDAGFVAPHHTRHAAPAAAHPPAVVKLPNHIAAPIGRDPFKALYVAPQAGGTAAGAAAGSGSTTQGSTGSTPTTTTSGGTTPTSTGTTTTTSTSTYHAVWVKLRAINATSATFDVGLSNDKTLKVVHYSSVTPLHKFAGSFELLSIRNGAASVRYGDGTPFSLTLAHPTMIVG